jgi:hypothetical protein
MKSVPVIETVVLPVPSPETGETLETTGAGAPLAVDNNEPTELQTFAESQTKTYFDSKAVNDCVFCVIEI